MSPYLRGFGRLYGFHVSSWPPLNHPLLPVMGQHSAGLSQAAALNLLLPPTTPERQRFHQSFRFQKASFCGFWIDPSPLLTPNWLWRRRSAQGSHLAALQSEGSKEREARGGRGGGASNVICYPCENNVPLLSPCHPRQNLFRRLVWLAGCDLTGAQRQESGLPPASPAAARRRWRTRNKNTFKTAKQQLEKISNLVL